MDLGLRTLEALLGGPELDSRPLLTTICSSSPTVSNALYGHACGTQTLV